MLFLNKLLPVFVLPLGIVVLLLLFALWRKKRWPIVTALVVLYGSSIPFTGNRLLGWLESRHPAVQIAEAGPADAVVVLGGILGPPAAAGFLPNWAESVERFDAGVALVQAGRAEQPVSRVRNGTNPFFDGGVWREFVFHYHADSSHISACCSHPRTGTSAQPGRHGRHRQ